MINVGQFKEVTKDCDNDTKILMSCFKKDYIVQHPECADNGGLYYDSGVMFEIDFNSKKTCTLKDFYDLLKEHNINDNERITSFDNDDGNEIEFDEVLIIKGSIILV
jgi:hypothetical protein